jgi:hypothetical protein
MLPNPTDTTMSATASSRKRAADQCEDESIKDIVLSWGSQLECWARCVPIRFAIVTVTLLFAAVITMMPPAFQTNDDAVMCMIVSGQGITLAPDEHMVFTNVIIGKILKTLYTYFPGMLWYGWYLVATQWIVTISLLYCFLLPRYTRLRLLGFAAYFLTAGIYFLVNLQFTSTANLTGIAGGMLLLQVVGHAPKSRREQVLIVAAASLLLVWGGLIRSDAFMLAVMLVSPALLVTYWLGTANRRIAVSACLALSIAAGMVFFAERYHQDCYSDPNWQAFYQYNPLRIKFNDELWVKYTRESKHVFDQVGWSKNDYEMIINWYFDDPAFDKENLSSILSSYPWMFDRNLGRTLFLSLQDIWRQRTVRAICFLLPAMLMFLDWRKRRYWPWAVAAVSALGLLLAVVVFRKAPPERVFMPVLAFPWLVLLHSLTPCRRASEAHRRSLTRVFQSTLTAWQVRNWSWRKPGWRQQLALRTISLLLVTGFSVNITKQIRIGKAHTKDVLEYEKMLTDFRPAEDQPQRLVLTFGGDFPFEHQSALFGGNNYSGLHFYCIGWPQRTPFAERMKQHYNIKSVGQALAEKHDMLVIVNSGAYGRIMQYLADHFSSALRIVNLKTYLRSNLSMIEPNISTAEFDFWDSPILIANPHLEPKGLRR